MEMIATSLLPGTLSSREPPPSLVFLGLWTLECLVRSNIGIPRTHKVIQGDGSRPRRMSLQGFPGSFLSGTLSSYGASSVARTSGRGHVVET